MANVNSTPTRLAKRPATATATATAIATAPALRKPHLAAPGAKVRVHAPARVCEPIPAYGLEDGVLSFRHGLRARERGTLDKALAIVGRAIRETGPVFPTPYCVKCYLQLQMAGENRERFAVLFLDIQNRCVAFETLFFGTLTQTSVYPREVVMAALNHRAVAVVLAHNHPSGGAQPSRADTALTQTLKIALSLIDVRVLDHVIVGRTETLSMAERGLM
jgi:DNA repair protein RadC